MYKSKIKVDNIQQQQQQQQQDFPIVCSSCLGDNPFMTMTKAEMDKQCKTCSKPYTVYRWKPGTHARFKKTEICKTCAHAKNVCQVCIHDLQFGLPVQIRDAALLSQYERTPTSKAGVNYQSLVNEHLIENGQINYDNFQPTEIIQKLIKNSKSNDDNNNNTTDANQDSYRHKRNQIKVCSFYLKGNCNRGEYCTFRHSEEDEHDPSLKNQNIKDRYYGRNDPVANKMLNKLVPQPPSDQSITTLYLSNVQADKVQESDLRLNFFSFGTISNLSIVPNKSKAFITFETREGAEKAIESLHSNLVINDTQINILWSKSNTKKSNYTNNSNQKNTNNNPISGLVSYTDEDEDEEIETNNNNNNNNNNNKKQTQTTESNENENEKEKEKEKDLNNNNNIEKEQIPPQVQPVRTPGIKIFPTFKINTTAKSSEIKVPPKPYYAAMDSSNYGSKV